MTVCCEACHGDGVVSFNRSRDPQLAQDGACELCSGAGERELEDELVEWASERELDEHRVSHWEVALEEQDWYEAAELEAA